MTPTQKKAHQRLMSTLPVREHVQESDYESTPRNSSCGKSWPRTRRAVVVDGVRYESMSVAAKKTGISRQAIYQRILRSDCARYAD